MDTQALDWKPVDPIRGGPRWRRLLAWCRAVVNHPLYHLLTSLIPAAVFFCLLMLETAALWKVLERPEIIGSEEYRYGLILSRITRVMFLSLMVAVFLMRRAPVGRAAGFLPRMFALSGTFMMMLLVLLPASEPPLVQSLVGFALVVVGSVLSVVALSYLGRSFSLMAEARQLVTGGPYTVVRHPLYVAEEVAIVGVVVSMGSPLAVLLLLVHIPVQVQRAIYEERTLNAVFPDYDAYRRRTPWRFIPGIC